MDIYTDPKITRSQTDSNPRNDLILYIVWPQQGPDPRYCPFPKMTTSHIWFDPRNDLILDIIFKSQNDLIPLTLSDPRENQSPDIARYRKWPDLRYCRILEMTWSQKWLNPVYYWIPEMTCPLILIYLKNDLIPDTFGSQECPVPIYSMARSQKSPDLRNCRNPDIAGSQKWLTSRYCLITKMT